MFTMRPIQNVVHLMAMWVDPCFVAREAQINLRHALFRGRRLKGRERYVSKSCSRTNALGAFMNEVDSKYAVTKPFQRVTDSARFEWNGR